MSSELGAEALRRHNAYIAAFNAHDITAIEAALHPDVTVCVGESKVAEGRSNILPSYAADFAAGSKLAAVDTPRPQQLRPPRDDHVTEQQGRAARGGNVRLCVHDRGATLRWDNGLPRVAGLE